MGSIIGQRDQRAHTLRSKAHRKVQEWKLLYEAAHGHRKPPQKQTGTSSVARSLAPVEHKLRQKTHKQTRVDCTPKSSRKRRQSHSTTFFGHRVCGWLGDNHVSDEKTDRPHSHSFRSLCSQAAMTSQSVCHCSSAYL